MSLTKKVFKNFSYLMIARVAFRFLTVGVMLWAARYLGVERYGMFETALAWSNAFLALNDIGMSTLIVREAARDEKKMAKYFGNTLLVEIFLSTILFGVIMVIGFSLGYNKTIMTLMAILGAAGLIYEFRKVMRGIFRVMLKLKTVAALEVLNGALYFFVTIWIISSFQDIDAGLLGIAHAKLWINTIVILALFIYTRQFIKPTFAPKEIWPMIKQSYVFTLYNFFFMLYFQIDQIILSIMTNSTEVGHYSAAAKLVSAFLFIPLMLFQVTMPTMYRYSKNNIHAYKRINLAKWRYLSAFGIPAGVGIWFLSSEIIQFVYGEEYLAAIPILLIMGWFMAVRFTGISQGNSLTTSDRQGLRALIQVISVAFNIILDIILIKQYGARGAAIATLLTEILISASYLYFSHRFLKENFFKNALTILPILLATAGMTALLFLAKPYLHVIVLVIFGAIAYLFLLWAFRFFKPYDRQILKQIASKS